MIHGFGRREATTLRDRSRALGHIQADIAAYLGSGGLPDCHIVIGVMATKDPSRIDIPRYAISSNDMQGGIAG